MVMQVLIGGRALMVLPGLRAHLAGTWRGLDAGYLALNIIGSLLLGIVAIEDRREWGLCCWNLRGPGLRWSGWLGAIRARTSRAQPRIVDGSLCGG